MNLYDILTRKNIVETINNNLDYILSIIPEIRFMIGFDHKHPHHHLDVWNHTLLALSLSENNFEIRLVLLLHDIGKPFSFQEGEVRHFKNHSVVSSKMSSIILKRLGYENNFIEEVCYLIANHDTPIDDSDIKFNEELMVKMYKIQECDALAHNPTRLSNRIKYLEDIHKKLNLNESVNIKIYKK